MLERRSLRVLPALAGGAALAVLLRAPPAPAQVAHPNQVRGTVGFTNTNLQVLAILDDPADVPPGLGRGLRSAAVEAKSLPPAPGLAAGSDAVAVSRLRVPYEITVESGPPGAGIRYDVSARAKVGKDPVIGSYQFAASSSAPVEYEPAADVARDLMECAGVVQIEARDPDGQPVALSGGFVSSSVLGGTGGIQADTVLEAGTGAHYIVLRGGVRHLLLVTLQVGSDVYTDALNFQVQREIDVPCDAVTVLTLTVTPAGGSGGLGEIRGTIDLLGEDEHRSTLLRAQSGPWGNQRFCEIDRFPSSGSFVLPNMMPSGVTAPAQPYALQADLYFGLGRRHEHFTAPQLNVTVPEGSIDLGPALVIAPGSFQGSILVAGPVGQASPLDALLGHVRHAADRDQDGQPDDPAMNDGSIVYAAGRAAVAPGARQGALSGAAATDFEGEYDPVEGVLAGDYRLLLGGLHQEPSFWSPPVLRLTLTDAGTPGVPESWLAGYLYTLDRLPPDPLVSAGSLATLPLHYCVSEVRLRIQAVGGTFFGPLLSCQGSFQGVDFEQLPADYAVNARFSGTPVAAAAAASEGMVVTLLPQGTYSLTPTITAINPGGGTSTVTLSPFDLTVGCREQREGWTDLLLTIDPPAACTPLASVTLPGRVLGTTPVDRITAAVNGGPPETVCEGCGVAPSFSFNATLVPGDNAIELIALDAAGRSTRLGARIHRAEPATLGNTLRLVKQGSTVRLGWWVPAGAGASEVLRQPDPALPAGTPIATPAFPVADHADVDAVSPAAGPRLYYRVDAVICP